MEGDEGQCGEQKLYTFGSNSGLLCMYKYYLCTHSKRRLAPQVCKIALTIRVPLIGIVTIQEPDKYYAPLDQHTVLYFNNKGPILNYLLPP